MEELDGTGVGNEEKEKDTGKDENKVGQTQNFQLMVFNDLKKFSRNCGIALFSLQKELNNFIKVKMLKKIHKINNILPLSKQNELLCVI